MSYQMFLSVGTLIGTREKDNVIIDDLPFQLQYRVASMLALSASIIVSATDIAGR